MPKPRTSDDPNALTKQLGVMLTAAEMERVEQLAAALGVSKSRAGRLLIREGFKAPRVQAFTPQDETDTP